MAYTTTAQLRIAAGSQAALEEISDTENAATLALAQAGADGEIDSRARRLWGDALPFSPVPDVIAAPAADETVYRLRCMKRVQGEADAVRRQQREETLKLLEAGKLMPPPADTYPIRDGGGAVSGTSTLTEADNLAKLLRALHQFIRLALLRRGAVGIQQPA